jgi:nitrogen fixation protein NifB
VTITINCVDPEVGAAIYPWVLWNRKRVLGRDAAAILIEQQQKGLEMCVARGILVKVNSVLIPGVNDEHLREVSRVVKAKGAFLHNVMPLISAPEHGTHYGESGQRGPTAGELQALQDACAGDMRMMRHCRQCRADAVGLLGEDRSAEFTLDKIDAASIDLEAAARRRAEVRSAIAVEREAKRVAQEHAPTPSTAPAQARSQIVSLDALRRSPKEATLPPVRIAVASRGSQLVDEHFGHATRFLVYEASASGVRYIEQRSTDVYCHGSETCGEAESALARSLRALEGCIAVLCSKIGYEPWRALERAGITPNGQHAMEPIEEAVKAVYAELRDAGRLGAQALRQSA